MGLENELLRYRINAHLNFQSDHTTLGSQAI